MFSLQVKFKHFIIKWWQPDYLMIIVSGLSRLLTWRYLQSQRPENIMKTLLTIIGHLFSLSQLPNWYCQQCLTFWHFIPQRIFILFIFPLNKIKRQSWLQEILWLLKNPQPSTQHNKDVLMGIVVEWSVKVKNF